MQQLNIQLVFGAVRRDADAARAILEIYDSYITTFSMDASRDEHGMGKARLDEDRKSHLQTKLLTALPKFSIERCLRDATEKMS